MTKPNVLDPSVPQPPRAIDWARHALFLDFDGTLAPLRDRPDHVAMAGGTRVLVRRALRATRGAVAILSGRELRDLERLARPLDIALSGSHGAELRLPRQAAETIAADAGLDAAYTALAQFAAGHDLLLERKPGAVALHFRNHPELEARCRTAVEAAARSAGRRAMHGNMVSEVALAGIDKGTALHRFMTLPPFQGRLPVMIGDDTTDEDGFGAAQALGGFGLRIGGQSSVAHYRVGTMDGALAWLDATLPGLG